MTDIQHRAAANGNSLFAAVVKAIAILATAAWAFAVLAFMAALNGPGAGAFVLLLALVFGTPIFVIFVLPALLFSLLGGASGAKVGAGFLVAGIVVVSAMASGPILRTFA